MLHFEGRRIVHISPSFPFDVTNICGILLFLAPARMKCHIFSHSDEQKWGFVCVCVVSPRVSATSRQRTLLTTHIGTGGGSTRTGDLPKLTNTISRGREGRVRVGRVSGRVRRVYVYVSWMVWKEARYSSTTHTHAHTLKKKKDPYTQTASSPYVHPPCHTLPPYPHQSFLPFFLLAFTHSIVRSSKYYPIFIPNANEPHHIPVSNQHIPQHPS